MQRDLYSETHQRRSAEVSGSGCQHKDTCQYHVTRSAEPAIKVPLQIFYDMAKDIPVFTELCQPAWQAFVYFFKIKQLNITSYLFCHLYMYIHTVNWFTFIKLEHTSATLFQTSKETMKVCFSWPKQTKMLSVPQTVLEVRRLMFFIIFFFIKDIWMQETITQQTFQV